MKKDYTLGLDIGTKAVGWSVMYDDYTIPSKKMKVLGDSDKKQVKKNFWGVRLFDEAKTAEVRRADRRTRRKLARKRNRLSYLQDIFFNAINEVDVNFFGRLSESFFHYNDKSLQDKCPLFANKELEAEYYNSYPTIYHLRKVLVDGEIAQQNNQKLFGIDEDGKADIRLVYMALHHAIKFRGHFLIEGDFNPLANNLSEYIDNFLSSFQEIFKEEYSVNENLLNSFERIIKEDSPQVKKTKSILTSFDFIENKEIFGEFLKIMVGATGNFKAFLKSEADYKLQYSSSDYDDQLRKIIEVSGDEYGELFLSAKKIYDILALADIIDIDDSNTTAFLSASMVKRYDNHKKDLKDFKKFIRSEAPKLYYDFFRDAGKNGYAAYIDGNASEEEFYKFVKTKLKNVNGAEEFFGKVDKGTFLKKQRTYDNVVLPNQLHCSEVQMIIENQKKFYPFLEENEEKILSILKFRIPYYVGPLDKNENSPFAWNVRKSLDKVRPWNFSKVVDEEASTIKFIEKLTNFDKYLPNEKVLPSHSLIYQRYLIFNVLTSLRFRATGYKENLFLTAEEKKDIFENLLKKVRKLPQKKLIRYIEETFDYSEVEIIKNDSGLEELTYSSYHDLLDSGIEKTILEDSDFVDELEDIIKILTVFDDRETIKNQLQKYTDILDRKAIKNLSRRKYSGWGIYSKRLLIGICDKATNKSIQDFLEEDDNKNRSLTQLINDNSLTFKETIKDFQIKYKSSSFKEAVDDLVASPSLKRGVLQSLYIVEEIIDIMGYKPKNIVFDISYNQEELTNEKSIIKIRENKIRAAIKAIDSKENKVNLDLLDSKKLLDEKYYLFFLQNGIDLYTGALLDIDKLSSYKIDYIIPEVYIYDTSLDNKVLTAISSEEKSDDDLVSEDIIRTMSAFWYKLNSVDLLSDKKLRNLKRDSLTENDKDFLLRKQLIEKRDICKNVSSIFDSYCNLEEENVNILPIKKDIVENFRDKYDSYKIKELNDYYHAHDAYILCVLARKFERNYSNLYNYLDNPMQESLKFKDETKVVESSKTNLLQLKEDSEQVDLDIDIIKKVLSYRQMNITKKLEDRAVNEDGRELFKKTIDKSKKNGGGKGKNQIKRKIKRADGTFVSLSIDKYGGYIEQKEAFISLDTKKKLKSVKRTEIDEYKDQIKIRRNQVFLQKDGHYRTVSSLKESAKWNQLVLKQNHMEYIYKLKYLNTKKEYSDFLESNRYLFFEIKDSIFDFIEKNKLAKTKDLTIPSDLSLSEEKDVIFSLLNITSRGTTAENAVVVDNDGKPKKVVINRRFRYMSAKNDRLKVGSSILINYSVTGLYETRSIL